MAESGSRSFDFGSDDLLCSYDDYSSSSSAAQEPKRPDPSDNNKDFRDNGMARPLVKIYEQETYPRDDVLSAVDKCMKKYADSLLRSLEGISGRLSQLEIYCYKLERSIGEFRSDMIREQSETETKLNSLEKHLQEVHRSIQIMRDKQELAETQNELTKLQLGQESSKKNEESIKSSVAEPKKLDDKPDTANQQLALALPHQVNTAPPVPGASEPVQIYKDQTGQQVAPGSVGGTQQDRYVLSQAIVYYPQRQTLGQDVQSQAVQPEVQYLPARPPIQDHPGQAPPTQQPQIVNQTPPQSFPQYQQQWQHASSQPLRALPGPPVVQPQQTFSQSFPPQAQQPQQSNKQQFPPQAVQPQLPGPQQFPPQAVQSIQSQHPSLQAHPVRPQTQPSYPPYPPHQPVNPTAEALPGSMPMQGQGPYNTVAPSGMNRSDVPSFAYGGPEVPPAQPQSQHNVQRHQPPPSQGAYGPPPNKGNYGGPMPYTQQVNPQQSYNVGYGYPSPRSSVPAQQAPPGGSVGMSHPGQPYGEMIEKAISMGYPRDQVLGVTQRMAESGQPVNFNALLDRLNELGSGAPPRAW